MLELYAYESKPRDEFNDVRRIIEEYKAQLVTIEANLTEEQRASIEADKNIGLLEGNIAQMSIDRYDSLRYEPETKSDKYAYAAQLKTARKEIKKEQGKLIPGCTMSDLVVRAIKEAGVQESNVCAAKNAMETERKGIKKEQGE